MPSIPLSRLPLCSSHQIITAIERLEAYPGESKRGSHASYHRRTSDGRMVTGVVVLGRREVPKTTLKGLLTNLDISLEDFLKNL